MEGDICFWHDGSLCKWLTLVWDRVGDWDLWEMQAPITETSDELVWLKLKKYCVFRVKSIPKRLFAFREDDKSGQIYYYTSLCQFRQLLSLLDDKDLERELCESILEVGTTIMQQMEITEELTEERRKRTQEKQPGQKLETYLSMDKQDRMREWRGTRIDGNGGRNGKRDEVEEKYVPEKSAAQASVRGLLSQIDVMLSDGK